MEVLWNPMEILCAVLSGPLQNQVYMWIYWIHLVAVFPAAAGAFCAAKMAFLVFCDMY